MREHECAQQGHAFEVFGVFQSDGPHSVLCSNCGKAWAVPTEAASMAEAAHLLDQAWDWLADQGQCDSRGGAEYHRILGSLLPAGSVRPTG